MPRSGVTVRAILLASALSSLVLVSAFAQGPIFLPNIENGESQSGFVLNGYEFNGDLGAYVSAVGDMNGDGFDDFITGSPVIDAVVSNEGQVYVVFGSTSDDPLSVTDIVSGTRGFAINGIDPGDLSGRDAAGIGDVNGDGVPDVAVGCSDREIDEAPLAGQVYVVFGKSDGATIDAADIVDGIGGFAINGLLFYELGSSLGGVGDMNGDGFDDLIVLANGSESVYVVFGKSDTDPIDIADVHSGSGGFRIFNVFADRIASAGDVNGDGIPDILISSVLASPSGRSLAGAGFVVFGKIDTDPIDLADVFAGVGGFTIIGATAQDVSGLGGAAGDVNGDGLGDLIIGAIGADPDDNTDAGAAYVVFGRTNTTTVDLLDVESGTGGFTMVGAYTIGLAGHGVSGAGDVNGDGLADLIVGATEATGTTAPGRVYVVYGKTTGSEINLFNVESNNGGYYINANGPGFAFGTFGAGVASADVNGDGRPDVIAGGPDQDVLNSGDEGRVWAIFNPVTPGATSTYLAHTRIGDGAGGAVVPATPPGTSRTVIDFSDDDSANNGAGAASTETVTITRSGTNILNLSIRPANLLWHVTTDRSDFDSANLTFRYAPAEVAHLVESTLRIFKADSPNGPWTDITDALDTGRNEITGDVTALSYFAIGGASIVPNTQTWVNFTYNGQEIGTQPNPFNTIKEAAQFIVANGTINIQPGITPETITIAKKMTLTTTGGTVRIGG